MNSNKQNRVKQKKVTVTIDEYQEVVRAENSLKLNGPNFIVTMARVVNNSESYMDIRPHIVRLKCGDME